LALTSLSTSVAVAQLDWGGFSGVYAVRREVVSSTCERVEIGSVLANVYLISTDLSEVTAVLTVTVAGARRFRELHGDIDAGRLVLAGSDGEGGSITVALARDVDGSLHGTETATIVQRASTCVTTRAVVATPLVDATPPRRRR